MEWAVAGVVIALLVWLASNKQIGTGTVATKSQIQRIAEAIARAEGFYTDSTLLQRLNNPVGLKSVSTGTLRRFNTIQEGWEAAYRQIELILTNESSIYNKDMTIAQIAPIWTGNDRPAAWAVVVSGELGVNPNEPIYRV